MLKTLHQENPLTEIKQRWADLQQPLSDKDGPLSPNQDDLGAILKRAKRSALFSGAEMKSYMATEDFARLEVIFLLRAVFLFATTTTTTHGGRRTIFIFVVPRNFDS